MASIKATWLAAVAFLLTVAAVPPATAQLAAAEGAWQTRAEKIDGNLADAARIEDAVRAYRVACSEQPEALSPRWQMLRALHYMVDFSNAADNRKQQALDEAVRLAKLWVANDDASGDVSDRAQLYFWAAIVWGVHGQRVGLLTIVREGVAGRIHDYAERAVSLDPKIERGGGYRLLSRLHAELPYVPLISGWVDRGRVLPFAQQAAAIAPDDPGNQLILALALIDAGRSADAQTPLAAVAAREPRAELLAEDLATREQARRRLGAAG